MTLLVKIQTERKHI